MALFALPLPAGLVGAGAVLIYQAFTDNLTENLGSLIGGSVLTVVGVVSLRLVLTAARHERETFSTIEARHLARIKALEEDNSGLLQKLGDLRLELDQERRLRMSLEAAGITDRRHYPPNPEEPPK